MNGPDCIYGCACSCIDVLEQLVFCLVTLTAFKFYLGRRKECSIKHYNIQNDYEPPSIFFPLSEIDKVPVVKNQDKKPFTSNSKN